MFIPSPYEGNGTSHREMDVENIQRLLESKLVQHKLSKLGLTKDEIQERLHQLDNEQLHLIASQIHTLESGGFGYESAPFFSLCAAGWIVVIIVVVIFLIGIGIHA